MANFIINGLSQIYDRVTGTESVEAKRVGPAKPAPVEIHPDPAPEPVVTPVAQDGYQGQGTAPQAFAPKASAATFQGPVKAQTVTVTPIKPSAPPPSVADINKRFARMMEAARNNPGLQQNPKFMEKVIQQIRNDHVDALATTAALTGDHELMGELQLYQETSRSVQNGSIQARNGMNPPKATADQKAAVAAHLEDCLYEDLVSEMPVAQ